MSSKATIPSPKTISIDEIKACVALYPEVVEAHYKNRIKDPKKATEAIKRDTWRYEDLPRLLKDQYAANLKEIPLDLAQLEKLVQWKITHGHSRPFLPAMIRKNDSQIVKSVTAKAADRLRVAAQGLDPRGIDGMSVWADVKEAVETLSELKGVGPATASLIASVYAPDEVPFFADETYAWLLELEDEKLKLKYDKKEYVALFDAVKGFKQRLAGVSLGYLDLEKAAFVLMHLELLEAGKRKKLEETLTARQGGKPGETAAKSTKTEPERQMTKETSGGRIAPVPKSGKRDLKATELSKGATNADSNKRRSKRVKA